MKYYVFITGALSISRNLIAYTTNPFMIRKYVEFVINCSYNPIHVDIDTFINEYDFRDEEDLLDKMNDKLSSIGMFIDRSNSLYQINSLIDDDFVILNDFIHDEFINKWFSNGELRKYISRLYAMSNPDIISMYLNYFRESESKEYICKILYSILSNMPEINEMLTSRMVECFDYIDECRMIKEYMRISIFFSTSLPF